MNRHHVSLRRLGITGTDFVVLLVLFVFSVWLMGHTFSYDAANNAMLIGSRLWSDFSAHIPMIRSFSLGNNWPPEYPLFPGEKIRYHFLFYLAVGLLERLGIRIDIALNFLSATGFFLMLALLYALTVHLFRQRLTAFLAVTLALFNGSLSFLSFFQKHPLSLRSPLDIVGANSFPAFGPWDGNIVTAFWNLNIYTNQRHLGASYAAVFGVLMLLELFQESWSRRKKLLVSLCIGFLVGSFFLLNQALLPVALLLVCWYLVIKRPLLPWIAAAGVPLALWVDAYLLIAQPSAQLAFRPGFLTPDPSSPLAILRFWIYNLGLHMFLIPLGLALTPKHIRHLVAPVGILFLIPNLIRFSPDMINNHKWFNFFLLLGVMFSAHTIVRITHVIRHRFHFLISSIFLVVMVLMTTFSGIIDFFVVKNDTFIALSDIPGNKDAQFFASQTAPNSAVLNSTFIQHPATIAGRKIYHGYPFFTWSAGYDTYSRETTYKAMYGASDRQTLCSLLQRERIDYVELSPNHEDMLSPNMELWNTFPTVYLNKTNGLRVFSVTSLCGR